MDLSEFQKYAHELVDNIVDYYNEIENFPVKSAVNPGDIFGKLPSKPPESGETMGEILNDFNDIIMPGITHWQSPDFFAYFPANSSYPSLLAEFLTAAIGAQCMKWETSPAAAELEETVMDWLRDLIGLPDSYYGVIQDTASTSTLAAILTAREVYSNYEINNRGFEKNNFRVYCSTETHSSIEKAVKIAGIGKANLVKIRTDEKFSMDAVALKSAIDKDISLGYKPLCIVATFGTTGSTAVDPIDKISGICREYDIWFHIDAAYAGSALILPEYKNLAKGMEYCDSFVFNPHKWLFTNFDCSAYFIKDKNALLNTFEIIPEYLKTRSDSKVNNYCDWGIPLGRRFRALKLWFVLRSFGVNGLREKLRYHIRLANDFKCKLESEQGFEILTPVNFNLVCFRYNPGSFSEEELNYLNEKLLYELNKTGKVYLSHTKLNGKYSLRMVIAQTNVREKNVLKAFELIIRTAKNIFIN